MTGPGLQSRRYTDQLARSLALAALCLAWPASTASAQSADTVLFNGKILTVDRDFSTKQALAIAHGQVLATGTSAAMKRLAGDRARLIDLGGRTVIPGLTDGHIHGIRAALNFGTEENWFGVPTLQEALAKISPQQRKSLAAGSWWRAVGPRSSLPRSGARPRPTSWPPRKTIRFTSSISTTGCC
jgi:predicted amidohydrolase YtcJ